MHVAVVFFVARVLVLDDGNIAEFAPPQELLNDTSSIFHGMCKNVGIKAASGETSNGARTPPAQEESDPAEEDDDDATKHE